MQSSNLVTHSPKKEILILVGGGWVGVYSGNKATKGLEGLCGVVIMKQLPPVTELCNILLTLLEA